MVDLTERLRELRRELAPSVSSDHPPSASPHPYPTIVSASSSPSLAPSESMSPLPSSCPLEPDPDAETGSDQATARYGARNISPLHPMPASWVTALGKSPLYQTIGPEESPSSSTHSLLPARRATEGIRSTADPTLASFAPSLTQAHPSCRAAPAGPRLTRIAKEQPVLAVPAFGRARSDTSLVSDTRTDQAAVEAYKPGAYAQARHNTVASSLAQRTLEMALAEAMAPAPHFDQESRLASMLDLRANPEAGAFTPRARISQLPRAADGLANSEELDALVARIAQLADEQPSSNDQASSPRASPTSDDSSQPVHGALLRSDEEGHFQSKEPDSVAGREEPARPFRSFPFTPILTPANLLRPACPDSDVLSDPESDLVLPSRTATPRASRLRVLTLPSDDQNGTASSSSDTSESPGGKVSSPARLGLRLPSTPSAPPGRQESTMAQLASLHVVRAAPGSSQALKQNIMARVAAKRRARLEGRPARSSPRPGSGSRCDSGRAKDEPGQMSALASLRVPRADGALLDESDVDNNQAASGPTDSGSDDSSSSLSSSSHSGGSSDEASSGDEALDCAMHRPNPAKSTLLRSQDK